MKSSASSASSPVARALSAAIFFSKFSGPGGNKLMKRSQINQALRDAIRCFHAAQWALPPNPKWDVTDCGLGRFDEIGLVLLNLAEQPEYCEKLMYSKKKQVTPMHTHGKKKEDIICRSGRLAIELWKGHPEQTRKGAEFLLQRNGRKVKV